ncbi:MAG TPA: hypothetical protein VM580_03405, partial [Labilithrix sp.]|nr:hypothetical protein [Labilithrix sp.]
MDASLPVLVSKLPDRRELARLVRAALRHEVAQVELTRGPQRAEAHALDIHVVGHPPLALLAEPAGAPENGQFPLRLKPLYRAQAAQLYALLEASTERDDGPPESHDAAAPPSEPDASAAAARDTDAPANVDEPSLSISVVFDVPDQASSPALAPALDASFFDDALANLPTPTVTSDSVRPAVDSFVEV